MSVCDDLPVLECEVPRRGLKLDLVLKPVAPVDGEPQHWPLFNADNPDECFGNMKFRFRGHRGVVRLNITLDLSAVPDRELVFAGGCGGRLDGVIALSPDCRHQFVSRRSWGDATRLVIRIRDKDEIPDNFSFLWLCEDVERRMHFVSGDPQVGYEPQ